ncbi:MAG: FliM/FliN family flagellar motor switch protein [Planctomycetota bacterium]|jgi:flagellar motor switch protein FliM
MSGSLDNAESKKRIHQLLAAIGSGEMEDTTQMEVTEYDWLQPHYFSSSQLEKLNDFTERTASMIRERLSELCHSSFDVTVASVTQHFADTFFSQITEGKSSDYHLAFGAEPDCICGTVSIPPQTAILLMTQLLGDSESEKDSNKALSQLEESLVQDIASSIVEIFSQSYDDRDFLPMAGILKGRPPLDAQGTQELCEITFNIKKADSEENSEAQLLLFCQTLDPILGKLTLAAGGSSAEDISKAILERLQETPISVTAQLGSAMLTLEEVVGLCPGDVLLLDRAIDEPVDLVAEGRPLLRGRPAKSAGKYAVVITNVC